MEGAVQLVLTLLAVGGLSILFLQIRAVDQRAQGAHVAVMKRLRAVRRDIAALRAASVGEPRRAPPGETPGAWLVLIPEEPGDEAPDEPDET